jgi:hypothetical protein
MASTRVSTRDYRVTRRGVTRTLRAQSAYSAARQTFPAPGYGHYEPANGRPVDVVVQWEGGREEFTIEDNG